MVVGWASPLATWVSEKPPGTVAPETTSGTVRIRATRTRTEGPGRGMVGFSSRDTDRLRAATFKQASVAWREASWNQDPERPLGSLVARGDPVGHALPLATSIPAASGRIQSRLGL